MSESSSQRSSEMPPLCSPSPLAGAAGPSGVVDWSKPRVASILRAAVRCFARSGFDTTTAEIAAEVGIPKSVIYHYFDDKTTLVREAQRFAYAEHLGHMKAALGSIHARTGRAVVATLREIWRAPESRSISFQLGIWSELSRDPQVREQAVALRREHQKLVAGGIARALRIEDPSRTEPLSTLIVAALTGLSLSAYLEGDETKASAAHEELLDLLARGIEKFAVRPDSDAPPAPGLDSEMPPPYDAVVGTVARDA